MDHLTEYKNIKVLMYHRVVEQPVDKAEDWHAVHVKKFRQQMEVIDQLNFTPITFEDYNLYLEDKLTLPKKPIIITFDDGHLDTFEVAVPVLREFNMRAVVFVVGDRELESAFWDESATGEYLPLMSDAQILDIRAEGFEIGAHTMRHPMLTELSQAEIKEEVLGSKVSIEKLLGEEILSFAYPYGALNQKVYDVICRSGFKFGCGVFSSPPRFGDDWLNIHRLAVGNNMGMAQFLTRLLMPYEYAEWVYNRLKGRATDCKDTSEQSSEYDEPDLSEKSFITEKNY